MSPNDRDDACGTTLEPTVDQLFCRLAHAFEDRRETVRRCYQSLLQYFSATDKVIDLGCGSGILLEELAKRGVSGIGVEIDIEKAVECEKRGLKVYRQRVQDFVHQFKSTVDGVVLLHVIEHMEGEEAFKVLAQTVSLLRPNGKLIAVTPNYSHGMVSSEHFWLDITHKRPYPLPLLIAMIKTLGLEVMEARVAPWNAIDLLIVGRKGTPARDGRSRGSDSIVVRPQVGQFDFNNALGFGLKDGRATLARCNERIVEIPFVHRNLPYPFRGRAVDVGSRESQLCFELACLGFETWALDTRPHLIKFPCVRHVQADIRSSPFPPAFFDIVIACSTVEHVGLAAYGNDRYDSEGDMRALQAIHQILKPGGCLILTVPFGLQGATDWYRVYDHDSLNGLVSGANFTVEVEEYWYQEGLQWVSAAWKDVNAIDSVSRRVQSVACILARPA